MDYQQYRASLIKGNYDHQLEALISRFDPDHKTVILLPGGMGSQLERTEHAYPASPNVINDVIWLDLGIAPPKYDARKIEIDDAGKDKDAFVRLFVATAYGFRKTRADLLVLICRLWDPLALSAQNARGRAQESKCVSHAANLSKNDVGKIGDGVPQGTAPVGAF